jgi:YVTN family beta-propeller protein
MVLWLAMVIAATGALIAASGDADAYTVYVSNEKDNSLTVIDSTTLEVQHTIPVGQRPRGIMLTKDGKSLLICASDDDTVQILDLASGQIPGTLPSGPDPEPRRIFCNEFASRPFANRSSVGFRGLLTCSE